MARQMIINNVKLKSLPRKWRKKFGANTKSEVTVSIFGDPEKIKAEGSDARKLIQSIVPTNIGDVDTAEIIAEIRDERLEKLSSE